MTIRRTRSLINFNTKQIYYVVSLVRTQVHLLLHYANKTRNMFFGRQTGLICANDTATCTVMMYIVYMNIIMPTLIYLLKHDPISFCQSN